MYGKQYFLNLIASFLRFALTGVGTWFVTNNIGTSGQWDFLIAGIALLLVNAASILYAKYKNRLHFLAALNSKPGTPEEVVRDEAKERAGV